MRRLENCVCAVLVCALSASLAAAASPALAAAAGSDAPRIVSPSTDRLVKHRPLRVAVKLPPGTSSFNAWLGHKRITKMFEQRGRRRITQLGGSAVKRGVNSIYVRTDGALGRGSDATNFIVARRDGSLLRLATRIGGRKAPLLARATAARQTELRARLNGKRVNRAFLHRHGRTSTALLGPPEGLRAGKNRLVVRAVRRRGSYDIVRRRFRVPRSQNLASAGDDRNMVVGTSIQLNAAATSVAPGSPAGGPRYHWRIVDSPPTGESASSGTAGDSSAGPLLGKRRTTPTFTPRRPGTYAIRVRVGSRHAVATSRDTVLVAVRRDDPPIGAPVQTAGPNGVITIDGKPVPDTGTDPSTISYALLDRTTGVDPTLCHTKAVRSFTGTVPRTVAGIQTLEQLVHDCSSPRYLLILSSSSGIGDDEALRNELSTLLKMIGGPALSDQPTQAQFSAIGVPTSPEGSAFTSFGEFAGGQQGRLSGYLQWEGAVGEYGFKYGDYPTFDTNPKNVPDGDVGTRVGDQLITDSTNGMFGCNPSPDRATPCAGFQVVAVDRYDLHLRYHNFFLVNTGRDDSHDATEQNAMRNALNLFGANDLVFIQSYGKPRATTPVWDDVAQGIQRLGGTRTVFDQLDGSGGYALVGSVCQPPGASGCNAGFGGSSAAVEASSLPDKGGSVLGDVASADPKPAVLRGVLARNRDDQFDAAPTDPTNTATDQLLPILYGREKPFPAFTGGEQNANAWITRRVFQNQSITPADMRQQYWLHYDDAVTWGNRRATLDGLKYAEAASSCGCTQNEFETVQGDLDKEIESLVFVEGWIEKLQGVLNPKVKDVIDLQQISDDVQAAVRPPDAKTSSDADGIFQFFFDLGAIVFPEEGAIASLLYEGVGLFTADDTGADGSPLLGQIQQRSTDFINHILVNYELARGGLIDMGKIIVSDYGKLMAVSHKVNGGPWALPSPDTPLRTTLSKGFQTEMYSELMPLPWAGWDIPQVGGANANTLTCLITGGGHPVAFSPFQDSPDSGQYEAATGFTGSYPQPDIKERTSALGRRRDDGEPFISDAQPPPASLTDPLFAPADLEPGSKSLGLYPPAFLENEFAHVTFRPPDFGVFCRGG